jgi:hypothetical protein
MLFQLYLMALVMVLVTAGLFVLSAQSAGLARDYGPLPVGRGLCLAPHTEMAGSPSWLALIFALVADGTLFTSLVFGAFYLWISACTVATRERWLAGLARLIARQTCDALRHEPRLPPPYHRFGFAGSPHDLVRAAAVGGGKDDFGAPNMLLRRVGSLTIASSRRRSSGMTLTTIPALMTRA